MSVTCYSRSLIRRRRYYLLNAILIILALYLIFGSKYNVLNSPLTLNFIDQIPLENKIFNQTLLNCSGDPLEQWCHNLITSCNASLVIFNSLFILTHSVILHPRLATGKTTGGEQIKDVLNQPEQDEYFLYNKGFLKLPCDISALDRSLPGGHLSSIFASATSYHTYPNARMISDTTVAVNRRDYVNIYHTVTDLYTVYLLCRFFQKDPKSVHILFLDAHPKGSLDMLWSQLFHSYTRLGHLRNDSSVWYKQLIWAQPQSKSELDMQQHRKTAPSFFFDFRDHVVKQFNAHHSLSDKVNCASLNLFFLVRRNYVAHPRNPSGKITRQLSNEKQILDDLQKKLSLYPGMNFSYGHFEEVTMEEQVNMIVRTDVFIGMHGAGLTHVLFMKSGRALVELATPSWQSQTHFELMASINNVNYRRCLITDGAASAADTIFSCIQTKVSEMCPSILVSKNSSRSVPELSV